MAISKFEIYEYWKDKAITKDFLVKPLADCAPSDEALRIIDLPDEVCCWACELPSLSLGEETPPKTLRQVWNRDRALQKAHILARSKEGPDDEPGNRFLLCPLCHAESPDTLHEKNFFAWVRYKRAHENYASTLKASLEKAVLIKGMDLAAVQAYLAGVSCDELMSLRMGIIRSCTMHGTFISMMSKMMALLDLIPVQQDRTHTLPQHPE